MRKFMTYSAGLMLSASVMTSAVADTITMWTMEEQPDRMAAQERIAADFMARTGHEVKIVPVTKKISQHGRQLLFLPLASFPMF